MFLRMAFLVDKESDKNFLQFSDNKCAIRVVDVNADAMGAVMSNCFVYDVSKGLTDADDNLE